jgi:16S rRNA pseudouridine516 synthase
LVNPFDQVKHDGEEVQCRTARHVMLNKPVGIVSATRDFEHRTVIDLIAESWADELHLAGRLDRFTSGLMILSNDSRFTESLTEPVHKVGKRYRVTVDAPILPEMVSSFQAGIFFAKEGIVTAPAEVTLITAQECLLTIFEGKHHQVKRMFARFGVKVTALHREAIGGIELDPALASGEWRELTSRERS